VMVLTDGSKRVDLLPVKLEVPILIIVDSLNGCTTSHYLNISF